MKPPVFDYAAPDSVEEAVALLSARSGNAKIISGGQSLMPMLAFRLAAPELLVDLKRIQGLNRIDIGADGVRLGAKVRWVDIERSDALKKANPLLAEAVQHVAHYQIRNRGTIGGSIAHADPAAEMPGIALTCEAEIATIGTAGPRVIKAAEFFLGPLMTALEPDEIIVEIRLPPWPARRRWGFQEFARRRGDFAMAAAAVWYDQDDGGKARNAHVGAIGVGDRPQRLTAVEAVLNGRIIDAAAIAQAEAAAAAAVDPQADIHASADYRRALIGTMVERALKSAGNGGES